MSKKIDDPEQILDLLNQLDDFKDSMVIFDYISEKEKVNAVGTFVGKDNSNETFNFKVKRKGESLENLKKILEVKDKVTLFVGRKMTSFVSNVVENLLDKTWILRLGYPKEITSSERREVPRTHLSQAIVAYINSDQEEYKVNLYDLGGGGFSVFMGLSQTPNIVEGAKLSSSKFIMGENEVNFQCEAVKVISMKPNESDDYPYGGTRISFKFIDLSAEVKYSISKYMKNHDVFKL